MTRDVPAYPKNLNTTSTQSGGYNITFTTKLRSSGKHSSITFRLLGSLINTSIFEVSSQGQGLFDPGKTAMVSYPNLPYIGDVRGIEIGVNAPPALFTCCSQWALESVTVHCLASEKLYTFHAKAGDAGIKRGSQTLMQHPSVSSNVRCFSPMGGTI
jgi:hypothetical protein